MYRQASQVLLFVAGASLCTVLIGCTFNTDGAVDCDGDSCGCSIKRYSYEAGIRLGSVPVEHASLHYFIPNAFHGNNSSCCDAIGESLVYGDSSGLCDACAGSPNDDVAGALATCNSREPSSLMLGSHLPLEQQAMVTDSDEPHGTDCYVNAAQAEANVTLNGTLILSATMELRVRWTDPVGDAACCHALQPVLRALRIDGRSAEEIPEDMSSAFCSACKNSPNVAVALAAYRCFDKRYDAALVV